MDNETKLDSTDARYVQCVYTDGNFFGTDTRYGNCHENFVVNGGDSQPGCWSKFPDLEDVLTCDHSRASDYFLESLNSEHEFWGIRCPLNPDLIQALNKTETQDITYHKDMELIGIHTEETNGTFCVDTNSTAPYALSRDTFLKKLKEEIKHKEVNDALSPFYRFLIFNIPFFKPIDPINLILPSILNSNIKI